MHSNIDSQGQEDSDSTRLQKTNVKKPKPNQREKRKILFEELKTLNNQLAIEQEKEKQTKLNL
tara:strand:- start:249 stop:437 length:189 start_codon:yes stop_codon:yes gene_type:complete